MPSKLDQLQQQFRQRIDQQKEEKLGIIRPRIYNENQQRILERVSKSNEQYASQQNGNYTGGSASSMNGGNPSSSMSLNPAGTVGISHPPARKNGSGVDRSRPLKPMLVKLAVGNELQPLQTTEQSAALQTNSLKKPTTGLGTMVLSTKPRTSSSSAPGSTVSSRIVSPTSKTALVPATKVEVKKTGSGNKVVSTTVKPNEIMKVTVETIKKATPPSSTGQSVTTTVKTTIHKRTITPVKTTPSIRNGHSSTLASSTPKSATAPIARRTSSSPLSSAATPKSTSAPTTTRTRILANKSSPAPADPNMAQCSICSRNFAKDRIEKHETICQKTSIKKRKPFDTTKMRVKGTEAESFVRKGFHKKEEPKLNKKSTWRTKHEEFINSIRQAKIVQKHLEAGGKLSDLPPPKPSENPDYVPCPHCGRKFNEGAAERHIPKCKNIVSNKKATPAKKK